MNDPAQGEPDPSGFAPAGETSQPMNPNGPEKPAEDSGKAFDWWGLRNSQPDISPADAGRKLDLYADWYEHLFCGFMKQSNAGGAEAWMHYVVALILLADQELGILDGSERDDLENAAEDMKP